MVFLFQACKSCTNDSSSLDGCAPRHLCFFIGLSLDRYLPSLAVVGFPSPRVPCPKCFETFKSKEGLKSHCFHAHRLEGRRRAKKKAKSKSKRSARRDNNKQRQQAVRKPRRSFTLEEKIEYVESYEQCLDRHKWEAENDITSQRISDFRAYIEEKTS